MIKTQENSSLEIWSGDYINNLEDRREEDKHTEIIQIETGDTTNDNYIVEVVRPEVKNV